MRFQKSDTKACMMFVQLLTMITKRRKYSQNKLTSYIYVDKDLLNSRYLFYLLFSSLDLPSSPCILAR